MKSIFESRDPPDIFEPIRRYINRKNAERIEYWAYNDIICPLTLTARARVQDINARSIALSTKEEVERMKELQEQRYEQILKNMKIPKNTGRKNK